MKSKILDIIKNLARIEKSDCQSVDLYLKVGYDTKYPVGNEILAKQNSQII